MDNPVTVAQALRHARHDFLNELQLIQMKLDLGREQGVQSIIRSHAEAAVQLNRLAALRMPSTENWLLTAEWRFPEFRFHLECLTGTGESAKDAAFAEWFERFFTQLNMQLDGTSLNNCRIIIEQQQNGFTVKLNLTGNWPDLYLPAVPGLLAQKELAADSTKILVSAKMEG